MLPLRLLFAAIFLVSLPFGLSSSSDNNNTSAADQVRALKAALITIGDDPNSVPPIGQTYDCSINVAVPPTPPAAKQTAVRGRCIWTVVQ